MPLLIGRGLMLLLIDSRGKLQRLCTIMNEFIVLRVISFHKVERGCIFPSMSSRWNAI